MITERKIRRRALLRGLGGAAVALPALDIMLDGRGEAYAQGGKPIPKRYVVCFAGTSLGGDNDRVHNLYVPDKIGPDYDLKLALQPLAAVKSEVSVVSGLRIPVGSGPGARRNDFHVSTQSPLLAGTASTAGRDSAGLTGVTSDQVVAAAIGAGTTFKSLVYRVQAAWYLGGSAPYGRDYVSARADASGKVLPVPATVSPRAAYDALFFGFDPPAGIDAAQKARFDFLLRARRSVLDLVARRTERLKKRLGAADQIRLARHFDEIRDLERRISSLPPASMGLCAKLEDPGADPPVGGTNTGASTKTIDINLGYSNEDERARIFADLVHMGFTCDRGRAAAIMYTMFQSHLNAYPLTGARADLHEVGHNGDPQNQGTTAVSKLVAWHVKHFAYLVGKLRDTPEGTGRLIDNVAMVLLHEGGHGLDPASGAQNSAHSSENMACLVAGRAGGLKPGRHVAATGKHPAQVLISAMKAVGVQGETLGDVSGGIPELFS